MLYYKYSSLTKEENIFFIQAGHRMRQTHYTTEATSTLKGMLPLLTLVKQTCADHHHSVTTGHLVGSSATYGVLRKMQILTLLQPTTAERKYATKFCFLFQRI